MQKEFIRIWKRRTQAQMDKVFRQGRERKSLKTIFSHTVAMKNAKIATIATRYGECTD
jgi:hypothetical protein